MSEGQAMGDAGASAAAAQVTPSSEGGAQATPEGVSEGAAELLDLDAYGSRSVRVTVDGQEMTLPLQEVLGGYQRAKASNKRFEDASRLRKQADISSRDAQTILDALGGDDFDKFERLLRAGGADRHLDQLMERRIKERLQYEAMSDTERQRFDFDKERAQFEQERDRHRQTRVEAQTKHAQGQILNQFSSTLASNGIKPGGEDYAYYVQHMAQHALEAHKAGVKINPAECFELVERERTAPARRRVQGLEADGLIEFLGEETLAKLRKADLARLKREQSPGKPRASRSKPKSNGKAKTMSPDEFLSNLRNKRGY